MAKSPAYQWYPRDILSSARVAELSLREEGAYRRALDYCWLNGSLPNNSDQLAKIIGKGCSKKIADRIALLFKVSPSNERVLIHDRLDVEREKQEVWNKKSSEGGRKSAELRAQKALQEFKGGSTTLEPPLQGWLPNGTNQSPTLQFASATTYPLPLKKERDAPARDSFSEPSRPSHAPSYEQVLEYFTQQGRPEVTEAFMVENDKTGWTFRDGTPIKYWQGWAAGFIRKSQKTVAKEADRAKKPGRKQSTYVLTRRDFNSDNEWEEHQASEEAKKQKSS